MRSVHSHSASDAKMILMEAVKDGKTGMKIERPLCLYEKNGRYTKELQDIYAFDSVCV